MLSWIVAATLLIGGRDEAYNFYQWDGQSSDWFEWWYTKVVVPDTEEAFFFVYGVVNPGDKNQTRSSSRAYVSVGSFADRETMDEVYPLANFQAARDQTQIKIGENLQMTDKSIVGALKNGQAKWNLSLRKDWSFNAMGWGLFYSWISNIFWYPAQAAATMSGEIEWKGRKIQIQNAPAYQDRNWGKGFPKWWAWIVSNSFENSPKSALAVGGGKPAAFQKIFLVSGLSIGLHHEGHDYVFRTTDADRVKFEIRFGKWEIRAENSRNERIEISAYAPPERFMLLPFVTPQGSTFYDYEALRGDLNVKIFTKPSSLHFKWKKKAELISKTAGLEFGSPTPQALESHSLLQLQ